MEPIEMISTHTPHRSRSDAMFIFMQHRLHEAEMAYFSPGPDFTSAALSYVMCLGRLQWGGFVQGDLPLSVEVALAAVEAATPQIEACRSQRELQNYVGLQRAVLYWTKPNACERLAAAYKRLYKVLTDAVNASCDAAWWEEEDDVEAMSLEERWPILDEDLCFPDQDW